jgi:malonyl-CoA/methylmalonyl-CoA synthetase
MVNSNTSIRGASSLYPSNYLANQLSVSSTGKAANIFAYMPDGSQISYDELFKLAENIAITLINNGVKPGDRVAIQVGKSIPAVTLYLGTILAGGVFLPFNTDYTATEMDYFLADATPTIFICDPNKEQALTAIAKNAGVKTLLTLASDGNTGTLLTAISAKQNQPQGRFQAIPRDPTDLAAILYTSGTTGRSKGAMLSHRALAVNSATLADYWQFTPSDRLIHALPIFHTHGLFVALNVTLTTGSSLYFFPSFDIKQVIDTLPHATVLMGVPTFYVRLLKHPLLNKQTCANMRLFISGSAPLLTETHDSWQQKTGHAILERYGMTETNMNTSNPYTGDRKPGTVGLTLPGVELKITDPESGNTIGNNEIGQIEVKGDNVFSGYWQMPEKTAEELRSDGWFITGDLGTIDDDGYVSIVGRSKDLIISGGFNVYPKEIESVIDLHPAVNESAVIGVPHPDFGEAVIAIVVLLSDTSTTERDIKKIASASLANYKCPKRIFFINELPRNKMSKVQKASLREDYKNTF